MTADPMTTTSSMTNRCGARTRAGGTCQQRPIAGTTRCRIHSGRTLPEAKARGAVVVELRRWGLTDQTELADPGETMLKLVTQSAARVDLYSRLLGEAYEAAERLRQAHEAGRLLVAEDATERGPVDPDDHEDDGPFTEDPAIQAARADLERIFATGGVGALIGVKRDADRFGRLYETEESIRGLANLEAQERDRCASFATKAIAAGLAERQVRLAERQGALLAAVLGGVLDDLALTPAQRELAVASLSRRLSGVAGDGRRAIEGSVV